MSTVGNLIIIEDVTERVHLEEQLQISDKMASIGLLAAGVAHEVNTPLTGISSFTQMLLSNADPDDPKTRMLEKIEQQTFRAAKIVNGLLNLSRSSGSNPEETSLIDLNAVISDVLSLLEPQLLAGKLKVRRELCPSPALVTGIEHKLQQVFLNLFLNARDAMPKGGWLSVSTRVADGHVLAEVADTGSGIPSEHLSRIYDPFFTTKLDRQRYGPRTIDYLRHRARARRRVDLSKRARSGNPVHRVAARVHLGLASGCGQELKEHMQKNGSILVVDDEEIMREILETLLKGEGYSVRLAASGEEGIELARNMPFDAAIVDIMMPGIDGMTTLESLKKLDDELPVIMVTAYASVESAITAMKRGAFDYITKPFKNDEVLVVIKNALERRRLVNENRSLRQNIQEQYSHFDNIVGRGPAMRRVFDLIIQAAPSRSTILIQGESGTGKELVARAIHTHSQRKDRAFVAVNSGNVPPDLLESTLFGHVRGAFTGAVYPKKGLFDLADRGSIFLDEIGSVPLETQAKLLRVMQEREFMRLGGMEVIRVDVRIIAATNVDLKKTMEEGRFREDLFYRLNVVNVVLPPLRERKDDIPLLVQHFIHKYGEENHKSGLELAPDALDIMMSYDWPGNVRELENVIERAVVLSTGRRIGPDLLPDHVGRPAVFQMPRFVVPPEGISFKDVITDFEKRLIESTLESAGGVQKRAAELLRIKPTTLNEMIKRYDIRPRRKRAADSRAERERLAEAVRVPE